MIVVVEGIDASGKTTLARKIANHCSLEYANRISLGHGPPATKEEMIRRLEVYLNQDWMVFDRHPAISQPIYGTLRNDSPIPVSLTDQFYHSNPVIIYARCVDLGLSNHVADSPKDTPEHLKALSEKYDTLLKMYDEWAFNHATIWYRNYRESDMICHLVQGALKR